MSSSRRRTSSFAALLGAAAAGVLLTSAVTSQSGAAAHLEVDGGVAQYWEFAVTPSPPAPQQPDVDLSECGPLDQYDEVVYGTEGDDVLQHDNGRQVLVGFGGDDRLEAGNHADCLVGGDGDDTLVGGNGKDVLVGGAGADRLDGGNGPDTLHADADDECVGVLPADTASGCAAADAAADTEDTTVPGDAVQDETVVEPPSPTPAARNEEPAPRAASRAGDGQVTAGADPEAPAADQPGTPDVSAPDEAQE